MNIFAPLTKNVLWISCDPARKLTPTLSGMGCILWFAKQQRAGQGNPCTWGMCLLPCRSPHGFACPGTTSDHMKDLRYCQIDIAFGELERGQKQLWVLQACLFWTYSNHRLVFSRGALTLHWHSLFCRDVHQQWIWWLHFPFCIPRKPCETGFLGARASPFSLLVSPSLPGSSPALAINSALPIQPAATFWVAEKEGADWHWE